MCMDSYLVKSYICINVYIEIIHVTKECTIYASADNYAARASGGTCSSGHRVRYMSPRHWPRQRS